jgi:ligand-binding sensor domain-containing protein
VDIKATTSGRWRELKVGRLLRRPFGLRVLWICAAILAVCSVPSTRANHVHMHGGPFIGVVLAVAVDPSVPKTLYVVAHGGGVFRSKNGGATWLAVNKGLPNRRVFSLLHDPRNRGRLYLGTDQGVFFSDNEGRTWRSLSRALERRNIRSVAIDPQDSTNLYVATDQGVFVGKNNQWVHLKVGLPHDVRAVVADSQGKISAGAFGGVYRLVKSKNRWQELGTGLSDKRIRALAIDPSSRSVIYAGTATSGVFRTTNGGESWQEFNRGLLNSTVMSLLYVPSAQPSLYAGTVDGIFESRNGKNQWQSIGPDLPFTVSAIAYNPKQLRQLYAGSGGRLYISHDAGKTWRENSSEIDYFGTVSHSAKRDG